NQFTVMRLRNRLRILLFNGVNGHLLRSPGRKAGILAEWMRKANDCSQKSHRNPAAYYGFSVTPGQSSLHSCSRLRLSRAIGSGKRAC
ncbi:MAG: hypothetical protein E7A34_16410, partial [Leclercia adecarboxylata]|nr:hypothetical protein [Leclercia adecarboxylata]